MGVVSNGMLCSGDELGLTADADGILILPADTPLGRPLTELFGDTVLDVDVKPNRGDALSIVGPRPRGGRRDRRAAPPAADRGGRGRPADRRAPARRGPRSRPVPAVRRSLGQRRPRSARRRTRIQMRLLAAGQRPISNVVDASNYVMLELGKPIHTFDAAAVRDGRIIVRRATAGERLETLDHVDRELDPETLVIADADGPIGIAGVMGGATSEVGDATTEVVVESAIFDPVSIRRTAFRYALRSEASLRFEKGQESRLARLGADRTARLIADWAGGAVAPGAVDTEPGRARPRAASRSGRRASTACSARRSTPDEQRALLARVGIETRTCARRHSDPGRRRDAAARGRRRRRRGGHRRDRADLAPRPRRRGRHRRGGHPGPRLRARPERHAAHPDAALPSRPAGRPDRRPRDAGRGRADRGRDLRPGLAADGRALRVARRRRPGDGARAAARPAGRSWSPTRCRASTRSCARA